MMKVTIDGKELEAVPGMTVLDLAMKNKIHIPTLCYMKVLGDHRSGACRICLIEVTGGGRPGLQASCAFPTSEGLCVSTNSEAVFQARRTVIELLLSEHVQDCRNCPISGNCNFAQMCREYDLNGVPVCAECPNQKEGCLLSRGVLCLGPLTYANCNAYCTRHGYRCEGCHTILAHNDVLKFGIKAYKNAGFTANQVLEAAKVFSFDHVERLRKFMKEEGFK